MWNGQPLWCVGLAAPPDHPFPLRMQLLVPLYPFCPQECAETALSRHPDTLDWIPIVSAWLPWSAGSSSLYRKPGAFLSWGARGICLGSVRVIYRSNGRFELIRLITSFLVTVWDNSGMTQVIGLVQVTGCLFESLMAGFHTEKGYGMDQFTPLFVAFETLCTMTRWMTGFSPCLPPICKPSPSINTCFTCFRFLTCRARLVR